MNDKQNKRQVAIAAALLLMLVVAISAIAIFFRGPSRRLVNVPAELAPATRRPQSRQPQSLPPPSPAHTLANSWGIQQINRAYQIQQAGDATKAEAILKEVMSKPVADKPDLQTWVPQLFVAPLQLADFWQKQGKIAEADALNRKVA